MALFSYKAKTPDGRVIDGQIEAENEETLTHKLKMQQLQIVSISKQGGLAYIFKMGPKVKTSDIAIFSRQFSTMISAGLPVLQALNILVDQVEDKTFKSVLSKVRDEIGSGANLSDAMSKFPNIFSPLYCNMIKAGELSGALDLILDRLSTYLEKSENLKQKIKGALSYPATIAVIAVLLIIVLMVKVVPTFAAVFESFGKGLPLPTKILIEISHFEQKWALVQIISLVAIGFIFSMIKRTEKGGYMIDSYMLKLPIFGPLLKKTSVARFSRTLGTLLKSGVQILDALETVARSAGNKVIEKSLLEVRASVREGQNLTEPLKAAKLFPSMVIQMVSVGEETGKLDDMLLRMADFYDQEVDVAVEALLSMLEPMVMAVLSVVVGGMVIGLYLPMFMMSSLVG